MLEALLDSTAYIDLERALRNRADDWAANSIQNALDYQVQFGNPFLSVVTVIEILNGLRRDIDVTKAEKFKQTLPGRFQVLDVTKEVGYLASQIMSDLTERGLTIGFQDSVIAATAIQHRLTLVTSNSRHFYRVANLGLNLRIANWRDI